MECYCCKIINNNDLITSWSGGEVTVDIPISSTPSIVITSDNGDVEICCACFKSGKAFGVFPNHIEQITTEFELEYKMRKMLDQN